MTIRNKGRGWAIYGRRKFRTFTNSAIGAVVGAVIFYFVAMGATPAIGLALSVLVGI